MKDLKQSSLLYIILTAVLVAGCSLSEPRRTEADFGNSVRNMIAEQTYDPDAAARNAEQIPEGYDAELGENVMKVYRKDVAKPKTIAKPIQIQIGN